MNKDIVSSLVRHFITGVGSILVAKGYLDGEMVNQLAGAIATIGGLAWAVISKKK